MSQKYGGLSQLADTVTPDHYPIKRRGQKRTLNPNWTAVAWIEATQLGDTELLPEDEVGDGFMGDNMYVDRAVGGIYARRNGHYARPMFQALPLEASSSASISYPNPCPACLDFSRSWACEEHGEIPYDRDKGGWQRPDVIERQRRMDATAITVPACNCPLCTDIRTGNRYPHSATPRPGPEDALRYAFPRFIEADRLRPQIQFADIQEEIIPRAQDYSFTAGAFTLSVDGETVEGVRNFTINFEEGGDDRRE
jgi:hypothetical protein